jgi:hypothetical protein
MRRLAAGVTVPDVAGDGSGATFSEGAKDRLRELNILIDASMSTPLQGSHRWACPSATQTAAAMSSQLMDGLCGAGMAAEWVRAITAGSAAHLDSR